MYKKKHTGTFVYPNIYVSQYVNSEEYGYTYKLKR